MPVENFEPTSRELRGHIGNPVIEEAEELLVHPASVAWRQLGSTQHTPGRIQVLKERPWHSSVYRLCGVGPQGNSVIAKRANAEHIGVERSIYSQMMPHLRTGAVGYYGCVADQDPKYSWLFIEDVGDERYRPDLWEHRALAGRFIGEMQVRATGIPNFGFLPDRGSSYYLESLQYVRSVATEVADRPGLAEEATKRLRSMAANCTEIEVLWGHVASYCSRVPSTFAHGDLSAQNLRIRNDGNGITLAALDWETAGRGVAGVDLSASSADLASYLAVVQSRFPALNLEDAERLKTVGDLFRLIIAMVWISWGNDQTQYFLDHIAWYEAPLAAWARQKEVFEELNSGA